MKLVTVLSFLVGSLIVAGQVRAETVYVYDLDSLVYLSTEVAEVEVTRSYKAGEVDLMDVKVTLVHKGGFKKAQTVAVWDGAYGKPKNDGIGTQRLAVGDRLVILVKRYDRTELGIPKDSEFPKDGVVYAPLQGGVRLVQGDKVIGFAQSGDFGGFEPVGGKTKLTVASFREKVKTSLRDTEEWARLIEAKNEKLDVRRLLKLLSERAARFDPDVFGRDHFSERVCIRFANLHDVESLSQALPLAKAYNDVSILQRGFGTPKGRDYLLAKVTDEKEPMPARLRYASALHYADPVYRSTLTEIHASGCGHMGEADEGNSGYITRIAKAAKANAKHEELCGNLVRCIDHFGQGIVQSKPAPMMADLRGALAVLKELYDAKPSQKLQFAIEKASSHVPEAYEKLKSPCADFISILWAADTTKYTKPAKRSLIFEYEYRTLLLASEVVKLRLSVVLIHQGTQEKHLLPSQVALRGWSNVGSGWTGVGGSGLVELPKNLAQGKYRVFLQVTDADKVVSTGHYFEADL